MEHLVNFLAGDDEQKIQKRKAVIFSSFVTFLEMWVCLSMYFIIHKKKKPNSICVIG